MENHVNVVHPLSEEQLLDGPTLAAVLYSRTLDRVIRSLSGSVAVSAYEIESISFPDADTLASWNSRTGDDLKRAVASATGWPTHEAAAPSRRDPGTSSSDLSA